MLGSPERPVADGRASTKQTVICGEGRETGGRTGAVALLNHLVRAQQQRLRDGQAERLGGFKIDDQVEFECVRPYR